MTLLFFLAAMVGPETKEPRPPEGVIAPYPLTKIYRAFGRCREGRREHGAIDIGGQGEHGGLGTPIVSMTDSVVIKVGRSDKLPWRYGYPDKRKGTVRRGQYRQLPRSGHVDGYGMVHFFTRTRGTWRTGNLIVARGKSGPLKDHVIRYMHLAAIHPDIKTGTIVGPGTELGLMGGTAVMESNPHLHLDVTAPDGSRVDLLYLLGLSDKPNRHCLKPVLKASK